MTYPNITQTHDDDNVENEASSLLTIMTASPAPSSAFGQDGLASTKKKKNGVPMRAMIATCIFLLGTIVVLYSGGSGSNTNRTDVISEALLLGQKNQAAPLLFDSQTDYCFKSKTVDQYCWYPTDRFPYGPWKGTSEMGDNDCGPMCNQFADDSGRYAIPGYINYLRFLVHD